jgi:transcriptional regulator with XRE-family HTH domain
VSSIEPDLYERCIAALTAARRNAGVSQLTLAERLGRPQSFVAKFEAGERRLDVAEFVAIAAAIGVDPFALLKSAVATRSRRQ